MDPQKLHAEPQAAKKNTINLSTQWFSEDSEIFHKKSAFLVGKIPSSTGRGPQSRGRLKIRSSPPLQLPISEAMEPSRPSPGPVPAAFRNVVLEHTSWFRLKWIQNA